MPTSSRFKVIDRSVSCHCCFSATVVDTSKPDLMANGEQFTDANGGLMFETVCESFDDDAAEMICDSLNKTNAAWARGET